VWCSRGKLEALGFEEDLVDLAPPTETAEDDVGEQDAGKFWKDFIRDTASEFRKPTFDQLETFMKPTWAGPHRGLALLRTPTEDNPGSGQA
jgi:hypothetical protein